MTRRQWLTTLAAAAGSAALVDAFFIEPRLLPVTRHLVGTPIAGSPTIRIVQLSDMHLRERERAMKIARATIELRPRLILITGDAIDNAREFDLLESFLDMLEMPAEKVAILGNWEHWARIDLSRLRRAYSQRGCNLLINESQEFTLDDRRLAVVGLDDLVGGRPDLESAFPESPPANVILLQHCPAYRDSRPLSALPPSGGTRFILSGHTHAGQFAPFNWAPLRPRGSGRYVQGWYKDDGKWPLYVSRGIGTSIAPVRLFAPPEIAVFDVALMANDVIFQRWRFGSIAIA
jgi:predicted MPP superfamily phosphohydrolase